MMKIVVKSVDFHADTKLVAYIEQKLSRLNRYFDKMIQADVHLKLQDTGGRVREKLVEIRLGIPGNDLIDKKSGKTFETAASAAIEALKRQIVRHKEKTSMHGRGVEPTIIDQE
ncbi:MAG TPA: ribosome-associated translation inhibitor RaiA [Saprospiraceae bacterium]|jgi:putative sigma-54 modulation protein|nr:ribosome-associated translation inhibitor RaiA [Saprospiraceae bacterium]HPI08052.1 ribosome-associated translation inhibitor RaiA [Saprospiraceae bacterium]